MSRKGKNVFSISCFIRPVCQVPVHTLVHPCMHITLAPDDFEPSFRSHLFPEGPPLHLDSLFANATAQSPDTVLLGWCRILYPLSGRLSSHHAHFWFPCLIHTKDLMPVTQTQPTTTAVTINRTSLATPTMEGLMVMVWMWLIAPECVAARAKDSMGAEKVLGSGRRDDFRGSSGSPLACWKQNPKQSKRCERHGGWSSASAQTHSLRSIT